MAKPYIHGMIDAKRFGGIPEDYLPIHNMMDSSKSVIGDNRHRSIFHHAFGIFTMEKIFGIDFSLLEEVKNKHNLSDEAISDILKWKNHCSEHGTSIKNSEDKIVQVRDVGESHCLSDFNMQYIPTAQDYLENMEMKDWMNNGRGGHPTSFKKIAQTKVTKILKPNEIISD